jgi:serine/threonine protein kinase
MGEVYRARDTRLGREVAIKVLPAEVSGDAGRLRRFEKEARSVSALNHPNIVTVHDIGTTEGISWIAMEKVEGETLRKVLMGGAMPMRRLLPIMAQIADGLAKAHEAGIVHRDLKPENVMVTREGRVKVLDFGLAKLTGPVSGSDEGSKLPTETRTSPGLLVGTAGYMSPEQASGEPVDFRSDQFSLGSILYEMTTGKRAFHRKTGVDTLAAVLNEEPEPITERSPHAPVPLRWIVERCLAKDPDHRYDSTKDLAREIATIRDRFGEVTSAEATARPSRRFAAILAGAAAAFALVALTWGARGWIWRTPASQPTFQRLTFRQGFIEAARFTADSHTVVYGARWDGESPHIFLTRPEAPESQKLDLPDANLVSISSSGELALVLGKTHIDQGWFTIPGTLATASLAGGAARELAEGVRWAEWSPDGKGLLVVRGNQIEFPLGTILRRGGYPFHARFSPGGDRIAFRLGYRLHVMDRSGKELEAVGRAVSRFRVGSLAWSSSGEEVLFTTFEGGYVLRAVNLRGGQRELLRLPDEMSVQDVSRDGRVLLGVLRRRFEVWSGSVAGSAERNLTIFGDSNAMGLSADGTTLLDNEKGNFYLRRTDGSLPKKLGEGHASELSSDGRWAASIRHGPPAELVLVPTGSGAERILDRGPIEDYANDSVRWSQDGQRVVFGAKESGHGDRLYVQEVSGGPPRAVTPEGEDAQAVSISPDGRFVIAQTGESENFWIWPTDGGTRRPVSGFLATDFIWRNWSDDGRYAYAWNIYELPFQVFRVELATGRREHWKTIAPEDPVGIWNADLMLTPSGKFYAYNCSRSQTDLYLVEGLR